MQQSEIRLDLIEQKNIIEDFVLKHGFHPKIKHRPIKRLLDIILSCLALIVFSPIFFIITIVIRIYSSGPVIYKHERIGRGGKPFMCLKFRTMYEDAEERLSQLLENDEALKNEWKETYKLKNDPRILPIGQFLRKTSLDELPQFWNVLKGDLSIVGPRPVVQAEIVNHYGEKATKILSMRPGITGIWQTSGRNDTSYKTRVHMDEKYIDSHSLLLDIKLIIKTIPCLIMSKGAY